MKFLKLYLSVLALTGAAPLAAQDQTPAETQLTAFVTNCNGKAFIPAFETYRTKVSAQERTAFSKKLEQRALNIKNEKQAELDKERRPVRIPLLNSLTLDDLKIYLPINVLIVTDTVTSIAAVIAIFMAFGEDQNHEYLLKHHPEMRERAKFASIILISSALGLRYLTEKMTAGPSSKCDPLLKDIAQLNIIINGIQSVQ